MVDSRQGAALNEERGQHPQKTRRVHCHFEGYVRSAGLVKLLSAGLVKLRSSGLVKLRSAGLVKLRSAGIVTHAPPASISPSYSSASSYSPVPKDTEPTS